MNFSKYIFTTILVTSLNSNIVRADTKEEVTQVVIELIQTFIEAKEGEPQTNDAPLVDCSLETYKPTASHKSLSSWAKQHHKDASEALAILKNNPTDKPVLIAAARACKEAIKMRGAAHCVRPKLASYRANLLKSKDVCHQLSKL